MTVKAKSTSFETIPGGEAVQARFGNTPSFHDAEIISLNLNRSGSSIMTVYWFRMTDQTDERGYFVLDRHALVTFEMEKIFELTLNDFSGQNVVFRLSVVQRNEDDPGYDIELEPCYGLSGRISCRSLSVSLVPLDGPGGVSAVS